MTWSFRDEVDTASGAKAIAARDDEGRLYLSIIGGGGAPRRVELTADGAARLERALRDARLGENRQQMEIRGG